MEKYENLGLVGEGSYGIVMKCRHKATGTLVAIKKFLESEDDQIVKRIATREIKMLKQLRHENLVSLIDLFKRRKKLFLVFEFVDYTLLDDLDKNPSGLEQNYARRILFQVLRGIEFCHGRDVIHRDIKPENILVSKSGMVKLCDFGFARPITNQSNSFTDYVATRWYRAPELLVGDTKYGKPVDIWAIGCLASEMFAGDPLFPGDSDIDQLFHIVKCIGYICPKHIEIFKKNALFKGLKIPESNSRYSLENRYPKMIKDVIYFIKKCLDPTPEIRLTCSQLLSLDLFPPKFAESLINEIRIKVQRERDKNPLMKNSLISQSPNTSKNDNLNTDTQTSKNNTAKAITQLKSNSTISKNYSSLNYKTKNHENNTIASNSNNNSNLIFKNELLNNQENDIISDNKNVAYVNEEAWENVRPISTRKERVASRAGRYPALNEEFKDKEDNIAEPAETVATDMTMKIEESDVTKRFCTPINKDALFKLNLLDTNQISTISKQEASMKISSSPRGLETPFQDGVNESSKPGVIPAKNNINEKLIIETIPPMDGNINRSSPTSIEVTQTHSLHFPSNSKKNIPTIFNNPTNGNPTLQTKTYNTVHQQMNTNISFHNYQLKQSSNNSQSRNFALPSDNMVYSYLPNIEKKSIYRQTNVNFHGKSLSNKPFISTNSNNVFKTTSPITNERSGFYYQNKKRPPLCTRQSVINYQDNNINLPELKGAEMSIIKNQAFVSNSKFKQLISKPIFQQNEPLSNNNPMDIVAPHEP